MIKRRFPAILLYFLVQTWDHFYKMFLWCNESKINSVMILSFWTHRSVQTVYPDQTAPSGSGSTLFDMAILSA